MSEDIEIINGKKVKIEIDGDWLRIKMPKKELKELKDKASIYMYAFEEGWFFSDMKTYSPYGQGNSEYETLYG